jgi:hypothetical protein
MALKRVAYPSPNYSSRGGAIVTTICLHTAEGALTIESLGAFFANPASGVSSHTGIDDKANTVGEYVKRDGKAWTAANANPWCVQTELCAFAAWNSAEWDRHPNMLANCAAWIAEEAAAFGIPIVGLSAAQAQNPSVKGICQHADLGAMGGGHWDCGPGFPMARVLDMAAGGPSPAPEPEEEQEMIMIQRTSTGGTAMYDGLYKRIIEDGTSAGAYRAAGIKTAVLTAREFDAIPGPPN